MVGTPTYWIILIAANLPVFFVLGKLVFGDWEGFGESVKYILMPDIWSWLRGEGIEDWWAEMKFLWWLVCCVAVVLVEHFVVVPWFV